MRYVAGTQHLTPAEAMKALGLSRAQLYTLVRRGTLRATWFGGRLYFPEIEVERFLADETKRLTARVVANLQRVLGIRLLQIFSSDNGKERP